MLAKRVLCNLLIASVALLPVVPARADMIPLEAAATAAQGPRDALLSLLGRPNVAARLEAQGVDRRLAQERVAAMTDAEALALAGELDRLPAGGDYGGGGGGASFGALLVVVLLIILVIWLVSQKTS